MFCLRYAMTFGLYSGCWQLSLLLPMSATGLASEYVELHEQVKSSTSLLDSLQTFLSTFQRDLSVVSDQIANLQLQSKDIDARLQSRKVRSVNAIYIDIRVDEVCYQKIENSLDNLIGELCMPPPVASVILDCQVDDSWFEATDQLEQCILALQPRSKLRATKDLSALTEGLRIVVGRGYFDCATVLLTLLIGRNETEIFFSGRPCSYQIIDVLQSTSPPE
jgi:hypothetical protein